MGWTYPRFHPLLSSQPNNGRSKRQEPHISLGHFIISGKNTPEMFDLSKETFNKMSFLV